MEESANRESSAAALRTANRWWPVPLNGWPWRPFLVGLVFGAAGLAALGIVVGGPLMLMHRNDLPMEKRYGSGAIGIAVRLGAGNAQNPLANSRRAIASGRIAFQGSCSSCHGATGDGLGMLGQATFPPATSLVIGDAKEKSDAQLFWIIKNGLSFTGMPAFGGQYNDQDIWSLVSYMRSLQQAPVAATGTAARGTSGSAATAASPSQIQLGHAVYIAQGCEGCHGTPGAAVGELTLRGGGRETVGAVRSGRPGMPAYRTSQLSDAEMAAMEAYMSAPVSAVARGGRG